MLKALILKEDDHYESGTKIAALADLLAEGRLFDVTIADDPDRILRDLAQATDYDLFVFRRRLPFLSDDARANLLESVNQGAGVIVTAAAPDLSDVFAHLDNASSREMCGPFSDILVQFLEHNHPITRGLRDFRITDQMPEYDARWALDGAFMLAIARADFDGDDGDGDGVQIARAVIAVTNIGRGRLVYIALGHAAIDGKISALDNDAFRRCITRSAEWASTGNVLDF